MNEIFNTERVNRGNQLIAESKRALIVGHRAPDGDAVGSSLGLYHALKGEIEHIDVMMPDDFSSNLKWIPGNDILKVYDGAEKEGNEIIKNADLIFCMDFNTISRTGGMAQMLGMSEAPTILIDHHLNPDEFSLSFSHPPASSTCELTLLFLKASGREDLISKEAAECLYVGLVTDTGSFKYAVTKDTHALASELVKRGVDTTSVHERLFDVNTNDRLKLLGYALSERMVHLKEKKTTYITLSAEDLARFNYQKGDTEGLVNYGLSIEGTKMAILASEKDGCVKISFRSKGDFDVSLIANKYFGGGGHKNAAGARSDIGYEPTVQLLKKIIDENA